MKRHLEIDRQTKGPFQTPKVVVLNVAAVLPKVDRNSIRTSPLRFKGRRCGTGKLSAPGFPKRRHMVDIDSEFWHTEPIR